MTENIITQNDETFYGCIPLDKTNTFVISGGAPASLVYQIRNADGTPVDLSPFFPEENPEEGPDGFFIKFSVADRSSVAKRCEPASIIDLKQGKIQIDLPDYIYEIPCIYIFNVSIGDKTTFPVTGKAKYIAPGHGVVLVEWTAFMTHLEHCRHRHRIVPSLEDVRRKLDDFTSKNDLLQQVEFSADDIVNAMIRPVSIFNSTVPKMRRYTYNVTTFPYYDEWVLGTAGELLRISAIHYMRNKLMSQHGGIAGDEKQRDKDYMQLAELYRREYQNWVYNEKDALNSRFDQGFGTMYSPYLFLR
jgi:hypothetical protein